jgi:hypothetical protein
MGKARNIKVLVGDIPPYIERNAKFRLRGFDVELYMFKKTVMIGCQGTLEWLVIPIDRVEELREFIRKIRRRELLDALAELYLIWRRHPGRFAEVPVIEEIARIVHDELHDYIQSYILWRYMYEDDC